MTRKEVTFTRIIRSRGMAALIALAAVFMTFQAYIFGKVTPVGDFRTIAFPTPSEWLSDSWISLWANIAYSIFTTAATPEVMGQFTASSLLAIAVMGATWIMFSIYDRRVSARRVYLVFFLLGLGQLVEYCFVLYIPVFIIALGQMKIFSFKKILAAILGNITPAWIAWGLALLPKPELPILEFTHPARLLSMPESWPLLAAVALTLLTGFVFGNLNLIKIMGFNAQARAYNGLLTILSIATGIFALVNFTNITFYIILLNACVAFQVGHFFRFTVMRRGYIAVVSLMAAYLGPYIWAMTV